MRKRTTAFVFTLCTCVVATLALLTPAIAADTKSPATTRRPPAAGKASKPAPPSTKRAVAKPLTDEEFVKLLRRAPQSAVSVRRLDAGSRKLDSNGWMQARAWSDARGMRYEVLGTGGSDRILNKVLKPVLDAEVEHSRASPQAAMTPDNYTFRVERQPDRQRVVVHIAAKRADVRLINGMATFSRAGVLQRIEGRLADRPSFWVKSVTVVREYAQVAGVTMPRSVESIADVRVAGLSRFLMTYDYEIVNGRRVRSSAATASNRTFTPDPSSHILALHLSGT